MGGGVRQRPSRQDRRLRQSRRGRRRCELQQQRGPFVDAEILPFDYESYGKQILEYVNEIEQQASKPSRPDPKNDAKKIDFAGLKAAAESFAKAGAELRRHADQVVLQSDYSQTAVRLVAFRDINRR